MSKAGIVYLTMAESKYPQKLAFVFLSEVCQLFQLELQNTYGTASGVDYLSKIENIDSQYAFLKFGKARFAYVGREGCKQEEARLQRCKCS